MQAEYKRDLQNNYLILESESTGDEENYALYMAEKNDIPGLLSFHSVKKDGKLYLHYEITSKQPLDSVYGRQLLGCAEMIFLLSAILELLNQMQKYLLNPKQLIFDPQYIYMSADRRKLQFCYFPDEKSSGQVEQLAEFLLKRLNHEETKAVELGYAFYQRTLEENFSLRKTLEELLREVRRQGNGLEEGVFETGRSESVILPHGGMGAKTEDVITSEEKSQEKQREEFESGKRQAQREKQREEFESGKRQVQREKLRNDFRNQEQTEKGKDPELEAYHVIHKARREDKKQSGFASRLFQMIHPAVLLSTLFLIAVLEVSYYMGVVALTEAGGLFFLILSVEMLIHKYWKYRKEEKKKETSRWITEEESEMYRVLQEEMYKMDERKEEIGETRCLAEEDGEMRIRLICTQQKENGGCRYPDIEVGPEPILVGKIRTEADVLLDSPTVSRLHAQLQRKGEFCCLKDLNSKNGTFCNGERLRPQETRTVAVGERISFAEIEYLVVRG